MRRSSRLENASAEKRKAKMSTRLAEHALRQRRELTGDPDDEPEEGEEVDEGGDSDFIASSEEEDNDDDEEEDDGEAEDELVPKRQVRKRKASSSAPSSSSEQDEKPQVTKIKSILKKQATATTEAKPKSILKRPKQHSAESSPESKPDTKLPPPDSVDAHRRPSKQRPATANDGNDRKELSFLDSLTRSRGFTNGSTSLGNTLTQFFIDILEWDFFDSLMRQAHKDFAVVTAANDGSEEGEVEVARVPSTFQSYEHYFSVWKPLALEEVQAQTLNAIFTDHPPAVLVVATGSGNSSFLDRTCKIRIDLKKAGVPAQQKRLWKLLDDIFVNDLVLITPNKLYFNRAFQVHSNGSGGDSKTAPTTDTEKEGFLGIVTSQRGSREGITLTVLVNEWRKFANTEAELFAFKLNNLVTSIREFRALCDCSNYRLLPLLLSGKHCPGSMQLDSLGLGYVRWLQNTFNESQLEAITAAATSEGFTLIKGPPGTGKTTTLKGLLNSIHLREYNRYYNAVLDVARRPDHETNKAWAQIGNEKPHILVTAPSNAAVDNIVGKIITEGFCDGEGRKYFPKIVRVGRGMSPNVRVVGLDELVDQICGQPYDVLQQKLIDLRKRIVTVERDSIIFRARIREVVAAINLDPVGILAVETQKQLQLKQQQAQLAQQVPASGSPLSSNSIGSPPPAPLDWHMNSSPPPPMLSPSSPSPPSSFRVSSPSNLPTYPSSPPCYDLTPSPPPAPHSPSADNSPRPIISFEDDQEEVEEEDEAFPTSYGPQSVTEALPHPASQYSSAVTSEAYNAFFNDDDEDMNAEEDEPLPNVLTTKRADSKATHVGVPSDHEDEDEAFPPLPSDPRSPSTSGVDNDLSTQESGQASLPGENGSKNASFDHNTGSEDMVRAEGLTEEPLQLVATQAKFEPHVSSEPTSPPPPPPPTSPPPPPPMSPPPPPPASPIMSSQASVDGGDSTSGGISMPAKLEGPIVYERYEQYRFVAQQLNSCLEQLSELRLEENRYHLAMRVVNEKGRPNQQLRQSLEVSFLDTAHIVFTTLSSAGVTALDVSTKYDVLVVDEAAQAVELSSIIPMKFGSRQCVLVGDPQQLSATVFSRTSGVSLYERSLFERLETTGHPVHMLRTQYRSHPLISDFPRHYFYDGKLQDADSVKTPGYERPYHRLGDGAFMPLVFWNLLTSRETVRSVSRLNIGEAEMAVNLYLTLKNSCPPDAIAGKVGVITPYTQQMEELNRGFRRALGENYKSEVEINTVDGFQGREKDIIILSTVRADPKAGVGFLNDIRRMNVALTRAKFACYVIGSEVTLRSSKPWSALMDHASQNHCIVHVQDPKCNLLTLRPMERPPGVPGPQGGANIGGRGGPRRRSPHVQFPPPPQHFPSTHQQPVFAHGGGPQERRRSPSDLPHNPRGPSPTNFSWRGGRGRGGGRDVRRDPRLNGRGGKTHADFGGPNPGYRGPPTQVHGPAPPYGQPAPHQFGPTNDNFGHGPASLLPPPRMQQGFPPGQFASEQPQVHPQAYQHQQYQAPPPQHHYQQPQFPSYQSPHQGPPPPVGLAGPPQIYEQPLRPFQDAGRGASGGRIRDPRLVRQHGGRGGEGHPNGQS